MNYLNNEQDKRIRENACAISRVKKIRSRPVCLVLIVATARNASEFCRAFATKGEEKKNDEEKEK